MLGVSGYGWGRFDTKGADRHITYLGGGYGGKGACYSFLAQLSAETNRATA